jgi:hypothetical protein
MSCIYLIRLKDQIYKYGRTQNYKIRRNGHRHEYKEFTNNIQLIHLESINKIYLNQAENDIRKILDKYKYPHRRKELLQIPNNELDYVKGVYDYVGKKYSITTLALTWKSFDPCVYKKFFCIIATLFSRP